MAGSPIKRARKQAAKKREPTNAPEAQKAGDSGEQAPANPPEPALTPAPPRSRGPRSLKQIIEIYGRRVSRGDRILEILSGHQFLSQAADQVGLSEAILLNFLATGRKDREMGKETDLTRFLEDVELAEAVADTTRIAYISEMGKTDWRALAWISEHKNPGQWGNKVKVETALKREYVEEFWEFFGQVLEQRVTDADIRSAITEDILRWPTTRSGGGLG